MLNLAPTAVSLFSGVGGIDLALERSGFVVTSAVEIDKAARGVLADRFPSTHIHTDVTKVTADDLRADGFVPERGLVAAGFPCQDLSVAGARRGMGSGTRSGLYWHVVRLLADLRPRWVLLENVPGLLSAVCPCTGAGECKLVDHVGPCGEWRKINGERVWFPDVPHPVANDGRGACVGGCMGSHGGAMGAVTGSLGELGYGFAYRVLDAQFFGVPQRRRRVVVAGCLGDERRPIQVLLEPEGSGGNHPPSRAPGTRVAATLTAGFAGAGVSAPGRRAEDDVNLVEVAPTLTARYGKGAPTTADDAIVVSALTASGVGTCGPDDNQAQASHLVPITFQKVVRSGARDENGDLPPEVWAEREVAATLNCGDNASESRATELVVQPTTVTGDITHALTAEGADASEDGTGRGTPIIAFDPKAGGDSTSSGAFEDGTGITPTLSGGRPVAFHLTQDPISSDQVAPAMGAKSGGQRIATDASVRRLTPRECERLQGFPDDWTATSYGKPQSDSPRYKEMGNAVAVPVFVWVAQRIIASDPELKGVA